MLADIRLAAIVSLLAAVVLGVAACATAPVTALPENVKWVDHPVFTGVKQAVLHGNPMPQMTDDQEPMPALFRTRTAQRRAPGATPTTPMSLFSAAMMPATWGPGSVRRTTKVIVHPLIALVTD